MSPKSCHLSDNRGLYSGAPGGNKRTTNQNAPFQISTNQNEPQILPVFKPSKRHTYYCRCWWILACAFPLVLSFFDIGQSLLADFDLCAPTRLVFFDIGQALLAYLCAPIRLAFFDIGQSLLVNFGMCSPTRLVFLTLVSCCWWTLTCALPLVLSFSHWSVAVGGLWLVRFHSSCLFHTGQSLLVDFGLCASTRLVFFDTGQSLLVDIGLCAPTRLVFFDIDQALLVEFDLCAPTRLVFFDTGQSLLVDFGLCSPTRLVFLTLVSRCWWTLACTLPLVLSF